jgi:hypothetical protein
VLFRLAWGSGLPLAAAMAGALVVAALHLSAMPAPGESVYWLAGGAQYTLAVALSIFAIAALVRAARPPRGGAWSALGFALVIAVPGLNEAAGLTLLFVLLAIAALATAEGAPSGARFRRSVLVAAIGCLVSVVAPGNAVRLAEDFGGGALTLAQIVRTLGTQARQYLVPWVTDVRLILASVLVLTSGAFGEPSWAQQGGRRRRVAVLVVAGVSTLIVVLLMALYVGSPGAPRLYNYVHAVFLAAWLVSLAAWSGPLRLAVVPGRAGALRAVTALLLALSLLAGPNTLGYLTDLTGAQTARGYQRRMESVYRALRDARQAGVREVTVPALPKTPRSFMDSTIDPDASHWQNRCVASFFGLARVAVSPGER